MKSQIKGIAVDKAAFFAAIGQGNELKVFELLKQSPGLIASRLEGISPVLYACYQGQPALARELAAKVDLDIWEAAALNDVEAIKRVLAENGALVSLLARDGFSPLHLAAFFGAPAALKWLLGAGAEVNQSAANDAKVQPLHSAVANSDRESRLDCTQALLEAGAEVNARQAGGFTALHSAYHQKDQELIALLLAFGADTQACSDDGRLPKDLFQ